MATPFDILGFPLIVVSKIGAVEIDCMLSENHRFLSSITENPVEDGTVFSDHVVLKPVVLELECRVSDALIFSLTSLPRLGKSDEAYNQLVVLQKSREPFDAVTRLNVYKNMLIEELSFPRSAGDGKSIRFSAVLKEILVIGTQSKTNRERIAADVRYTGLSPKSAGVTAKVPA